MIVWAAFVGVALAADAVGIATPWYVAAAVLASLALLYEVGLTAWRGQTVGKRALGMVVVDDSDHFPTAMQSLMRYIVKTLVPLGLAAHWLPALALVLGIYPIVLLLTIANDSGRRGWHDRVARTAVLEVAGRRNHRDRLTSEPRESANLPVLNHSTYGRYSKRRIRKS